MHWLLSDPNEPLRLSLEERLSPTSVPKLIDRLSQAALGSRPQTAPENLGDQRLVYERESVQVRLTTQYSREETSEARAVDDAREEELTQELETRGLAFTEASQERRQEIEHDRNLHEATQTGDFSKIDVDRATRHWEVLGTSDMGRAKVYIRYLHIRPDGELREVDRAQIPPGISDGKSRLYVFYRDGAKRFLVRRQEYGWRTSSGERWDWIREEWAKFPAGEEGERGFIVWDSMARGVEIGGWSDVPIGFPSGGGSKASPIRGWRSKTSPRGWGIRRDSPKQRREGQGSAAKQHSPETEASAKLKSASLDELKARARADPEAAHQLVERTKALPGGELKARAKAGDETARMILRDRPARWTRSTSAPEIVSGLRRDLRAARQALGPQMEGTLGVAWTDLALKPQTFKGASPYASIQKPLGGEIKAASKHSKAQLHAEEVIVNRVWEAVQVEAVAGKLDPKAVKGRVFIHVEREVCAGCRQGTDSRATAGVLKEISKRLPKVEFEITAEGVSETIRIQDGRRIY
jgi:hypothetical protein